MKINHTATKKGFTLVELLVVIMIVVSLASMGFVVGRNAMTKADELKAKKACTDLVMAIDNFRTDHNGMPPLSRMTTTTGDEKLKTENNDLISILINKEDSGDKINQNGSIYFSAEQVKVKRGGLYMKGSDIALYDPWGNPFFVIIDADGDSEIIDPKDPTKQRMLRKSVIVMSAGEDGDLSTVEDNVYSF